jgi:nucleotide-binding universal stress UspA family protein
MNPIRTIVVGTDFSEIADAALDQAIELARRLDAGIVIVHAYELPIYGFPDGALLATPEVAARLADHAQAGLDAVVRGRRNCGVPIQGHLRQGVPWEEILAAARTAKADLVVVGTHGRRGLAHALLGSVAERVVRAAGSPVLTVPAPRGP